MAETYGWIISTKGKVTDVDVFNDRLKELGIVLKYPAAQSSLIKEIFFVTLTEDEADIVRKEYPNTSKETLIDGLSMMT